MYSILLALHNLLRWVILLLLLINIVRHFSALKKPFTNTDKKLGLWLMIAAHTTLLIGLYQWFAGALGLHNIENVGMQTVMKNDEYRFFAVEHTVGMLVAIALITIARGVYRKPITDSTKHTRCIVFYLLALVIILACIPWPGMEGIGRPLLRNF